MDYNQNNNNITPINTLEQLPREMIIEILSRLSPQELSNVFATSKSLNDRFRPSFQHIIDQAYEEYMMPPERRDALMNTIEQEIQNVSNHIAGRAGMQPCLLSPEMTRAMGLNNFYTINGRAIYDLLLLYKWWDIYIDTNRLIDNNYLIRPDEFMIQLGLNPNQRLYRSQFDMFLGNHIDCQTPIIITPEIATVLNRERNDLNAYLSSPPTPAPGPFGLPGIGAFQGAMNVFANNPAFNF